MKPEQKRKIVKDFKETMKSIGRTLNSLGKQKRKHIPKSIRNIVWKKYNGQRYNGRCFVCPNKINTHTFHLGHVVAFSRGGSDKISNLRPICSSCNLSMKDMNLYDFKKRYIGRSPTRRWRI